MGKVLSVLQRKANRFNVENRAHKILEREKPTPAPMYQHTKEQLEKVLKEYPEVVEQLNVKDDDHDRRLKDVYVKSNVIPVFKAKSSEASSKLPQNRRTVEDPEFGFYEPEMIPVGRVTLRQAMKFITDHQTDPKTWSVDAIAKEYKLSTSITEQVLKYYRCFDVYIPPKEEKTAIKASPKGKSIEG